VRQWPRPSREGSTSRLRDDRRKRIGVSGRVAGAFINSKLTPLFLVASVLLGVFATLVLPREEEPQIIVR